MKKYIAILLVVAVVCGLLGLTFQGLMSRFVGIIGTAGSVSRSFVEFIVSQSGVEDPRYIPIGKTFSWNPFSDWGFGEHNLYSDEDIASAKYILGLLDNRHFMYAGKFIEFESPHMKKANKDVIVMSDRKAYYTYVLEYLTQTEYDFIIKSLV